MSMWKWMLVTLAFLQLIPEHSLAFGRRRHYTTLTSPKLVLGTPAISGTGCPIGTASAAVAPDGSALTVLFDQMKLETGGASNPKTRSKQCIITVPIELPAGMQLTVTQADFRGFNSLPAGASSSIGVYYSLKDRKRIQSAAFRNIAFAGPVADAFSTTHSNISIISKCGGKMSYIITINMLSTTNSTLEPTLTILDSLDLKSTPGIQSRVEIKGC